MLKKLINFILSNNTAKYFIVGIIIAIVNSVNGHYSLVLIAAALSGLISLLLKVPFLDDKLNYDQRQSAELNALLLSSILWAIYMWKDLHDFPAVYTATFVLLTFSIFNLFKSLKKCLYLLLPILVVFVLLSTLVQFPSAVSVSIMAVLFTSLFLWNKKKY